MSQTTDNGQPGTDNQQPAFSYGHQTIDDDDIAAVIAALKSDWLTQGPAVQNFENALVQKFGGRYATAVANGTAGLHLIAMALGWKKDDVVITSPITFLARIFTLAMQLTIM